MSDEEQCPMCASKVSAMLGMLGMLMMVRCRDCGCDYSVDIAATEEEVENDDDKTNLKL